MSFAVSLASPQIEWAGSSLATVFGQKRNLLRPEFWRMLADILRFNRESVAWLAQHADEAITLRAYLAAGKYSRAFSDWYLLPMASAIWSCPAGQMLDYPLATFVRFCSNHGLLQVFDRPAWRTVKGGGREYVSKLAAGIGDIRLATPVRRVLRTPRGMLVAHDREAEAFDHVVLACHSDQALALLGEDASAEERRALAGHPLRAEPRRAAHRCGAAAARPRVVVCLELPRESRTQPGRSPVSVSYLINRLQPLPFEQPVVVTLNPQRAPARKKTIASFDLCPSGLRQRRPSPHSADLPSLSGRDRVWFCGAWDGYGFHEDGLRSGLAVAGAFGCRVPWHGKAGKRAA